MIRNPIAHIASFGVDIFHHGRLIAGTIFLALAYAIFGRIHPHLVDVTCPSGIFLATFALFAARRSRLVHFRLRCAFVKTFVCFTHDFFPFAKE
jgi:hypothetical protein